MAPTSSNLQERIIGVNGVAITSYSPAAQDTRETVRQVNQAASAFSNPDPPMTTSLASPMPVFAANGQLHPPIEVNQAYVASTSQQAQSSSSSQAPSSTGVNSTIKSKQTSFEQRRIPSPAV